MSDTTTTLDESDLDGVLKLYECLVRWIQLAAAPTIVTVVFVLAAASTSTAQTERRFGEICSKLTTDNACKVCEKNGASSWICKSHAVWRDIPGSNGPVPYNSTPKPSAKPAVGSAKAGTASAETSTPRGCYRDCEVKGAGSGCVLVCSDAGQQKLTGRGPAGAGPSYGTAPSHVSPMQPPGESQDEENVVPSGLPIPTRLPPPSATAGSGPQEDPEAAEAWDEAKDIVKGMAQEMNDDLVEKLKEAKSRLNPSDFARYKEQVERAQDFLKGFADALTAIKYLDDAKKFIEDPHEGWHDIVKDAVQDGFDAVLKRVAPNVASIAEGPVGWFAQITFESSSTQSPAQDFDPMTAINNPGAYSFQQRVDALQLLYQSEAKHPEVWNDSKRQWLYHVTEGVYNSPDNPNIHLTPPDNPNIHLTPP